MNDEDRKRTAQDQIAYEASRRLLSTIEVGEWLPGAIKQRPGGLTGRYEGLRAILCGLGSCARERVCVCMLAHGCACSRARVRVYECASAYAQQLKAEHLVAG